MISTSSPTLVEAPPHPLLMLDPQRLEKSANPRRKPTPPGKVSEIAASMKKFGVLEPLIVRAVGSGYQVVAGDTRQKAAIEAGLPRVPCSVRELSDLEVLEIQLIENIQRNDMHPLDEGETFRKLIDGKKHTAETLASTIGKSARWVWQRMEFTKLIPAAKEAFLKDEITASHAERLVRWKDPKAQRQILDDGCFSDVLNLGNKKVLASTAELDDWISEHMALDLSDERLPQLLPEVAEVKAAAEAQGAKVLQVATTYGRVEKGVLEPNAYKSATGQEKCKLSERAVVVVGADMGTVTDVCINKACPKHWPTQTPAKSTVSAKEQAAETRRRREHDKWREKQAAQRAREDRLRVIVMKAKAPLLAHLVKVKAIPPAVGKLAVAQLFRAEGVGKVRKVLGKDPAKDLLRGAVVASLLGYFVDAEFFVQLAKAAKFDLKPYAPKSDAPAAGKGAKAER